jgi:hypothetical protein
MLFAVKTASEPGCIYIVSNNKGAPSSEHNNQDHIIRPWHNTFKSMISLNSFWQFFLPIKFKPYFCAGEMSERFNEAVLKTVDPKGPGVRIPLSPQSNYYPVFFDGLFVLSCCHALRGLPFIDHGNIFYSSFRHRPGISIVKAYILARKSLRFFYGIMCREI